MKRNLLILLFFSLVSLGLQAQDGDEKGMEKIRDRMNEYIQRKLDLNKAEAEKFAPVFLRYFREWKGTLQQYKGDKLMLRQKVAEVQIRFRTQFREVIGEKRSEEVFRHQRDFIEKVRTAAEHRADRGNPRKINQRFAD